MKRIKCPSCLGTMTLIRDGEIARCKKCGDQYDPTYADGFTDGFNKCKKQIKKG